MAKDIWSKFEDLRPEVKYITKLDEVLGDTPSSYLRAVRQLEQQLLRDTRARFLERFATVEELRSQAARLSRLEELVGQEKVADFLKEAMGGFEVRLNQLRTARMQESSKQDGDSDSDGGYDEKLDGASIDGDGE